MDPENAFPQTKSSQQKSVFEREGKPFSYKKNDISHFFHFEAVGVFLLFLSVAFLPFWRETFVVFQRIYLCLACFFLFVEKTSNHWFTIFLQQVLARKGVFSLIKTRDHHKIHVL